MLTFEDCVSLCELTEDEIQAISLHENIPAMAAAELGHYLCHTPEGEMCVKSMIRDDIRRADQTGARERTLALKLVLRNFVLQHPRCDERRRQQFAWPERRVGA